MTQLVPELELFIKADVPYGESDAFSWENIVQFLSRSQLNVLSRKHWPHVSDLLSNRTLRFLYKINSKEMQ